MPSTPRHTSIRLQLTVELAELLSEVAEAEGVHRLSLIRAACIVVAGGTLDHCGPCPGAETLCAERALVKRLQQRSDD